MFFTLIRVRLQMKTMYHLYSAAHPTGWAGGALGL